MTRSLIGLDVGTTHVKAVLLVPGRGVRYVARRDTPVTRVRGGGTYHDPAALLAAARGVVAECASAASDPLDVSGIGVASMAEAGVPLGRDGEPLGEITAWFDARPAAEAAFLESSVGAARLFATTGLRADAKYSLAKLLWWRGHRPAAYGRMAQWAGVAELVVGSLVGPVRGRGQATERNTASALTTNASLACRTLAFDVARRAWDEELLGLAGLQSDRMPQVVALGTPGGGLAAPAAAELGLRPGIPVAVAGHDHLAGAIGAGVVEPGQGLDSIGSAEVALVVTAAPSLTDDVRLAGFSVGCHPVDGRWYVLGGLQSSGALVEWWIETFLPPPSVGERAGDERYVAFLDLLARSSAPPGEILVRPYLRGRTAPDPDPSATLGIAGLHAEHGPPEVAAAIVDGAAFHVRWMFERLEAAAGTQVTSVRATGGGTRNPYWLAAKAALGPWPLAVARTGEAAALGAALVAGIAAGEYGSLAEALRDAAPNEAVEADPHRRASYDAGYRTRWLPWIEGSGRGGGRLP